MANASRTTHPRSVVRYRPRPARRIAAPHAAAGLPVERGVMASLRGATAGRGVFDVRWWVLVIHLLLGLSAPAVAQVDPASLRALPVLDNGRVKPIDTVAREYVRVITGRAGFGEVTSTPGDQRIVESVDPLLLLIDWHTQPQVWDARPILYVPNLALRSELGMDPAHKWISPIALRSHAAFMEEAVKLDRRANAADPMSPSPPFTRIEEARHDLLRRLQTYDAAVTLTMYPVLPSNLPGGNWFSLFALARAGDPGVEPINVAWRQVTSAAAADDKAAFDAGSAALRAALAAAGGATYAGLDQARLDREVLYNRIHPFGIVALVYGVALVGLIASTMVASRGVYVAGLALMGLGILMHSGAFALRSSITGWAPVTNIYETVVWVGLVGAVIAMVMELIYRTRTIALSGAAVALLAGVVGEAMPPEYGHSFRNLAAVLRSNLWLTVHVLTIVSSYAAFALALVLGNIVLTQHLVLARRRGGQASALAASIRDNTRFIYRTLQVGVLLVAAGTILGGLWADVSWGRFWGWDPKEVWALIVLLVYLALLHGRFAGWVNPFGLAVGAVVCFTTVLMSWYGVNFVLGVGLHSYGFGTGGQGYVGSYVALQLAYVGVVTLICRAQNRGAMLEKRTAQNDDSTQAGASGNATAPV